MSPFRWIFTASSGSFILAFGLYQIHSQGMISEGGTLGLSLLLDYWFHLSPAISTPILNGLCYLIGVHLLGKKFLIRSCFCCLAFSLCYHFLEQTPLLWPQLADLPFTAGLIGGVFVGVGVGLCVRAGCAPSGDDALAMALNDRFHIPVQRVYLISDATVLLLSLSYIPPGKVIYSLLTVILSGQIIGLMQKTTVQ